jgi:hypothetical protein
VAPISLAQSWWIKNYPRSFGIPTPKIVVTEQRVKKLRCSCGDVNKGAFSPEVQDW